VSRILALLFVLGSVAIVGANVPPPPSHRIPCYRTMKLEKAQPDIKFFTVRASEKDAGLVPFDLTTDKWIEVPNREKKVEGTVAVYGVPADEAKKYDKPADLYEAIKARKVKILPIYLESTASVFVTDTRTERRVRHTLIVNKDGSLSYREEDEPKAKDPAPGPTKALLPDRSARDWLVGVFAALSLAAGGLWFARRR
jgi:hypothetical protein